MNLWNSWVSFVGRPIPSGPLVAVKRLVAAVLIIDLLAILVFGVWDAALFRAVDGGLVHDGQPYSIDLGPNTGPIWWGLSFLSLALVASGLGGRWILLLAVFAYAQLGHFDWPGDRAIDRICRTVLLMFVFSDVGRAKVPDHVAAWPGDLLRVLLVIVYVDAGLAKLPSRPSWLATELNPLYTVMTSPQVGRLDAATFFPFQPLFAMLGAATLVLELSSPLLLFRRTAPYWALVGVVLHGGLAFTMNLGIFPFAMLALYPPLLEPWRAWLRKALSDRALRSKT